MTFNWHSESVQINSITILHSEKSAEEFLDKIYPHWTDTIVVSADGVFPKDTKLKNLVIDSLSTNVNLPIVVFGANSLKKITVASTKKLIMDDFFQKDMYRFDDSEIVFNWDARSIAMFCFIWVNQNGSAVRENYADFREIFHPQSVRWYNNLIYE